MADYDRDELLRMQSDAVRQAKEMQQRAQHSPASRYERPRYGGMRPLTRNPFRPRQESPPVDVPSPPEPPPDHHVEQGGGRQPGESRRREPEKRRPAPPSSRKSPKKAERGGGFDLLKMLNFKGFDMDSDRIIILMLLVLLAGEDTDELLLLALVYIMM